MNRLHSRHGCSALVGGVLFATLASNSIAQLKPQSPQWPLRPNDLACAPRLGVGMEPTPLQIVGSQQGRIQYMYSRNDTLVVNGGRANGLDVGQEYSLRRLEVAYAAGGGTGRVQFLETVGRIRIAAVEEHASIATVVDVCDSIHKGDFLQAAEPTEIPTIAPPGEPDYTSTGTILFGRNGRALAGLGEFFVIDIGTSGGLSLGQRMTLYRDTLDATGPVTELGEAVAVLVTPSWSTVQITRVRDFVYPGDRVAPHK